MKIYFRTIFLIAIVSIVIAPFSFCFAKTDISILETDITFSKTDLLDGDSVRIYGRVFNVGDTDVSGYVVFLKNNLEMANPQPISLKPNTYDDVFIDWQAKSGTYNIEVKIVGANPADENSENNATIKKDVFIDLDTDKDGIGDSKDIDTDDDGLTNEEEKNIGTDPFKNDTDEDGVSDKVDAFPFDKTEWRDTNNNGVGDNKDPDADGDGLTNIDETQKYGTNPLSSDSDLDGLQDEQEIKIGTDPNKSDTDGDGVKDLEDKFPLDPSKFESFFLEITLFFSFIMNFLKSTGLTENQIYMIFAGIIILFFMFLIFRKKKRRRGD